MAKINIFPNGSSINKNPVTQKSSPLKMNWLKPIYRSIIFIIQIVLAIFWIPIKWILSIDCFFQLLRMMYYWNTPGIHAGWTFLMHFALLTTLMIFITSSKPIKNFSR